MEGNKEEALRCLSIAQRHRSAQNHAAALRFARKSVSLYSTPEGEKMVLLIQEELATFSSSAGSGAESASEARSPPTSGAATPTPSAKASGVEEHVTSARQRGAAGAAEKKKAAADKATEKPKAQYTAKQLEVVTRVKRCRHHAYYEILAVEKSCSENDVKRAYKKLALALHPDKNSAPGADEAFKMVSKAFQVLSDKGLREVYDMNPTVDPTQRGGGGGGGGMARGFPGGGGMRFQTHPGFQQDINPEDLFNMFFGGGMDQGFGGPFGGARGECSPHAHTHEQPREWQASYPGEGRHPESRASPGGDWWYEPHFDWQKHQGWPSAPVDPRWQRTFQPPLSPPPPFPHRPISQRELSTHALGYCRGRNCYFCGMSYGG